MASQQCITPNADISGIGVRVAIYVQSFLFVIQAYMAIFDGKVDSEEEQQIVSSWTNSMLFGIGISMSAIIQAGLGNLSIHHGLVTLNLCWLGALSEFPFMDVLGMKPTLEVQEMFLPDTRRWVPTIRVIKALRIIFWLTLGVVVWASVDPADPCAQLTDYVILFKYTVSPASRGLRFTSLTIYASSLATWLIASFFSVILMVFICKCRDFAFPLVDCLVPSDTDSVPDEDLSATSSQLQRNRKPYRIATVIITFIYQAYFIACTEIMVKKNAHLFIGGEAQEDEWTFGQTLALLMLSAQLLDFGRSILRETKGGDRPTRSRQATDVDSV